MRSRRTGLPRTTVLAAAVLATALTHACGDGAVEPPTLPDPPRPTTVTVTPATAVLPALGATMRLTAEVHDQYGQPMVGTAVTWASSDATVATVDDSGLVTGLAEGLATVTAAAGGALGTSEITVVDGRRARAALVALNEATDGPNWVNSQNWLTDAPLSEWYGVSTDDAGRVLGLDLRDNGLTGPIPSELGNLASLKTLYLFTNDLTGPIPPELGNLADLEILSLGRRTA